MSGAILVALGGSHDVLQGSLVLPLVGVWSAQLEVDADAAFPVGDAVQIVLARDNGGAPTTFVGVVVEQAVYQGRGRLLVSGGAGKLAGPLAVTLGPRSYVAAPHPVPVLEIVRDILTEAGETLAPAAEAALAGLVVPRWLRAAGTGAAALRALAAVVPSWRVLVDGTVWAGAETWPDAPASATTGLFPMGDDGQLSRLTVGPESAELAPGTVVLGRRVVEVLLTFGSALRAELSYGEAALAELYRAVVAAALPPAAYARSHDATVRAQSADGSLDLEVDSPEIGVVTGVPLRLGILGARCVVPDGARVRLAFENGDPSRPFCAGLDLAPAASRGVARLRDTVAIRLSYVGTGTLLWHPPGDPPPTPVPISAVPVTIYPEIDSASEAVLLG